MSESGSLLAETRPRWVAQGLERVAFALLLLLAGFFAFERTEPLVKTNWLVLTNVEVMALAMVLTGLSAAWLSRKNLQFPRELLLPLVAWLSVLVLSALMAPSHQDKTLLFLGRVLLGVCICLTAFSLANSFERRLVVVVVMAAGAVMVAALGLSEWAGVTPIVAWLDQFKLAPTRVGDILRVSSTLSYATIASMVLEMTAPLLLILLLMSRSRFVRVIIGAGIVILLAALVLTLSRAGIATLLIVFLMLAGVGRLRNVRALSFAALGAAAALLAMTALLLIVNPVIRLRLTTETERAWYQAEYAAPISLDARAGEVLTVPVSVTNTGERIWTNQGDNLFALAYHLHDEFGESVTYEGQRTYLPGAVRPGETAMLEAWVSAPPEPGEYRLEWDMVQEAVNWFSWENVPTYTSLLTVHPGSVGPVQALPTSEPPTDIRIIAPTVGRLDLWRASLQMFLERPLVGVGPDNVRWLYGDYMSLDAWDTGIHANNLYLEWLADTGILGLMAFLWFSWRLVNSGLGRIREQPVDTTWLIVLGVTAGLCAWYIHGLLDYFYEFTPTYVAFWLLTGLLASPPQR